MVVSRHDRYTTARAKLHEEELFRKGYDVEYASVYSKQAPIGYNRVQRFMSRLAVWTDVHLWPGQHAAFRALADKNAQESVASEPGCHRFDVVEPDGQPQSVLLFALYADRSAYETHLASAHHKQFLVAGEPLCASMSVTTGLLVCEGGA